MGTLILLAAVFVLTAAFSFVVAARDTPNAVALPIASGALTPISALSMTAVMRMAGAIMGVRAPEAIGSATAVRRGLRAAHG